MTPDHYATLGVPPTAKTMAIRAAYLALMREYHPDRNRDPAAVERTQAVIAAFKVLGDFDRRNHYDWDRRRAREAAEAAASKRPPRIWAGAVGAGAIGLTAIGAWVLMPHWAPRTATTAPQVAEARQLPEAQGKVRREQKRVAVRDTTRSVEFAVKAEKNQSARKIEPRAAPARIAKDEQGEVPGAIKPKAMQTPLVRVAAAKAPMPLIAPPTARPLPPRESRIAATPVRAATNPTPVARGDLASLDQFVMGFYGQSWRYGDAPRRAALEQSRASFTARRGGCVGDRCKRDAYLKLMRDVSTIVESGQTKTP